MNKKSIKFEDIFKLNDKWYEYAIGFIMTNPKSVMWDRFCLDSSEIEEYVKREAITHPNRKFTICKRKKVQGGFFNVKERTYAVKAKNIYNIIQTLKLELI